MRTWPIYGAEHHVTAGGGAGVVFCDACAEINTDGELILPCSPDDPCRCCMHAHIRALNEEIRSRRAQAETDRRVFDKVQSLHHNNGGERWCVTCEGQEWPCETHLALEGDDL